MRTITTTVTVYSFDELSKEAQRKAVEEIGAKLVGEWWDQGDDDAIRDAMVYKLAEMLRSPQWDTKGEGDFPGIDGVSVESWDLDRGQHLALSGTLTRTNAPNLPWVDIADSVRLTDGRYGTNVEVIDAYPDVDTECECSGAHSAECPWGLKPADDLDCLEEAVKEAIRAAWQAGYDELEYRGSEKCAQEHIEASGYEFFETGKLYG